MANRPANAGSSGGLTPPGNVVPPAVHHDVPGHPRTARGHRSVPRRASGRPGARAASQASGLAWVPYLIVLAGVATGMFIAWQGSRYAGRGAGVTGCSLLAAGVARLVLPPRLAGLLSSRRKASDVLTFAAFGAGVLAVALMLP